MEQELLQKVKKQSLQEAYPEIAAEWHPTKNGTVTPDDVTPGSPKKMWWICQKGHEWQARIADRVRGNRCPYCSGKKVLPETSLAAINPGLAAQWNPTKNGELTPEQVAPFSYRKVWWLCPNGHEWEAQIRNRSNGNGCPYCAGQWVIPDENDLETLYSNVAAQWHPTKNLGLKPNQVKAKSMKMVWWICEKGHEWKDSVYHRTSGRGCPYCVGQRVWVGDNDLATLRPDIAAQWNYTKNGELTPEQVTLRSSKKVWWLCENGHEWQATVYNRTLGCGCPICYGRGVRSAIVRSQEKHD